MSFHFQLEKKKKCDGCVSLCIVVWGLLSLLSSSKDIHCVAISIVACNFPYNINVVNDSFEHPQICCSGFRFKFRNEIQDATTLCGIGIGNAIID